MSSTGSPMWASSQSKMATIRPSAHHEVADAVVAVAQRQPTRRRQVGLQPGDGGVQHGQLDEHGVRGSTAPSARSRRPGPRPGPGRREGRRARRRPVDGVDLRPRRRRTGSPMAVVASGVGKISGSSPRHCTGTTPVDPLHDVERHAEHRRVDLEPVQVGHRDVGAVEHGPVQGELPVDVVRRQQPVLGLDPHGQAPPFLVAAVAAGGFQVAVMVQVCHDQPSACRRTSSITTSSTPNGRPARHARRRRSGSHARPVPAPQAGPARPTAAGRASTMSSPTSFLPSSSTPAPCWPVSTRV